VNRFADFLYSRNLFCDRKFAMYHGKRRKLRGSGGSHDSDPMYCGILLFCRIYFCHADTVSGE
jgi:hypothetical protein